SACPTCSVAAARARNCSTTSASIATASSRPCAGRSTASDRSAFGPAMIEFFHVGKDYGADTPALRDVTLKIEKGDFVFLTGASGAGKSTLLKLIFAAERPTRGQILVMGRNVAHLPPRKIPDLRRQIGVVFQDFRLLRNRTVAENV